MKQPELDWRVDDAPEANEPAPAAPAPQRRRARGWRAWLPWLGVLGALALGAYAFQRLGWQRLNAQVAAEARFEDERALARDSTAVLAMQAFEEPAWRYQRSAEAALGLPAPLPAPHLAPAGTAPQLLRLEPAGGDVFTATVRREFVDAAGRVYAFDLTQRYRNEGAGLWQRLPPLAPAPAEGWQGTRLAADSLPQGEQAVWQAVLPQVDALLVEACADWACPESLVLRLAFAGQPDAVTRYGPPAWAARANPAPAEAAYAATLDLLAAHPGVPLSTPHKVAGLSLIGAPAGEAERQLLVQAMAHNALYHLAARLSSLNGPAGDPFFAALLVRATVRLGLAQAPPDTPPALDSLLSPTWLWERRTPRTNTEPRPPETSSLEGRLLVLRFLNHTLRDQPPTADGPLLRGLLRTQPMADWLSAALDPAAALAAPAEFAAALMAAQPPAAGPPALDATGLYFVCDDNLARVGPAGVETLVTGDRFTSVIGDLAVSERLVAFLRAAPPGGMQLVLVGTGPVGSAPARVIAEARRLTLLGWSAAGQLLYLARNPADEQSLVRYDPATDRHTTLFDGLSTPELTAFVSWSADRTAVGLERVIGSTAAGPQLAPAVVRVTDPVRMVVVAEAGRGTWLSPDGRQAAYLTFPDATPSFNITPIGVRVVALDNPGVPVAEAQHPLTDGQFGGVGFVSWSPDGQEIVYGAGFGDDSLGVFALALDGGEPRQLTEAAPTEPTFSVPAAFSADGRYLAIVEFTEDTNTISLMAWPGGPVRQVPLSGSLTRLAWSPTGHTVALPTTGGLVVADAQTGAWRWVTFGRCNGVGW